MRVFGFIFVLLSLAAPPLALAKHPAPPQVEAVTNNGVRYVVPNDNGLRGYVEAWDIQTGQRLWTKTIFRHWYIPPFGTECMRYEYLTTMSLQTDKLVLTSDRGRAYTLDIHTRTVRRIKKESKPAAGNAGIAPQLTVEHHWPGVPEPER